MEDVSYNQKLLNYLSSFITEKRLEKINNIVQHRTRHITIVLEDVFQPHNISAVLRSCDCFGVQDVHIIENKNKYQVNPDVALGADKWLSLYKYNNFENNTLYCINKLKNDGYKIVATTPHKYDISIENLPLENKMALFFGTEMNGISKDVTDNADMFVRIPMYGFTESFNISVSVAITLFSIVSRLKKSDIKWQLNSDEIETLKLQWVKNSLNNPELLEKEFLKKNMDS